MQTHTNAAMAWARFGWRRIVLIAAAFALALALAASLGTPGAVSADADVEDGTELVASRWKTIVDDDGWLGESMFARGPSWT